VIGACLVVAGAVQAFVPASEFTLAWTHSVEKIRWEERYRVVDDALVLVEARAQGTGAGLEIPANAHRDGSWWVWRSGRALPSVIVANSPYGGDYALCANGTCQPLARLAPAARGAPVTIEPCDSTRTPSPR